MAYGHLSVWIREPDDCTVTKKNGIVWAWACCNHDEVYEKEIVNGHAQFDIPPGCYIVDARVEPGCCGMVKETMVIVKCDETVCVNLLREYGGDPYKSIIPLAIHAEEAKISKEEIEKFVGILEKVGKTIPERKVRKYTEKELGFIEKISDKGHKEVLKKYRPVLLRKK